MAIKFAFSRIVRCFVTAWRDVCCRLFTVVPKILDVLQEAVKEHLPRLKRELTEYLQHKDNLDKGCLTRDVEQMDIVIPRNCQRTFTRNLSRSGAFCFVVVTTTA